jgi:hypothetical protein
MTNTLGSFDLFISQGGIPEGKKDALIAAADTMFMGKMWFTQNGFEPTAEQLLRFAELVLRYEIDKEHLSHWPE